MGEWNGSRRSGHWYLFTAAMVAWLTLWSGVEQSMSAAGTSSVPKEAQEAYDKKQYGQVIDLLAKLEKEQALSSDVRRLRIHSFLKLANPKDALGEYDKLELALKHDEIPLLREVALGFIVVMVKDMRDQMRGAAYTALKEVDSDEVVPYFEDGLSDGSGPVRVLAVEGLGRSEAGRKSTKLRAAIEDQAGLVKARVVKILGRTGDPGVMPLVESATKDELSTVRIAAYAALIRLGKKEAWTQLHQAAESLNPEDRADAIRTIADLNDQRGVPIMIESLTYKQPSVRGAAARGLGHLGRKEVRGKIELLLKDPIPGVRESAVGGLADLGGTESVPALTQALGDGSFTVRASAIAGLLQLGQPYSTVAPTVLSMAQQNDTAMRASAAYALGKATKANAPGAIALLTSLTADPLPGPKIVALRSLGHVGDRELVPLMKELLHDTNDAVRATAAGALLHLLQQKK
ncbi:MAG: HEAT repeat domain-containing protein [Nitrospirota bacterium]|nr:HEAT repeat domain-containing protein [Nitrospirota bacterium]MDP2382443.1 HEAT repeat domain-containing protein [Nitrospirota bacterium]